MVLEVACMAFGNMNNNPNITSSVILPAHGGSIEHLNLSLDSILNQTMQDFECIMIDDSCDLAINKLCDGFSRRDHRFKHLLIRNQSHTLPEALNIGIRSSRGRYIARMDSDDICNRDRLRKQLHFMENNPNIGVLGTNVQIISNEPHLLLHRYPLDDKSIKKQMTMVSPISHPSVMMRRDILDLYGFYNEDFLQAEDVELWYRLSERGVQFANLDEPLLNYRRTNQFRGRRHFWFYLKAKLIYFRFDALILWRAIGIFTNLIWLLMPNTLRKYMNSFFYRLIRLSR